MKFSASVVVCLLASSVGAFQPLEKPASSTVLSMDRRNFGQAVAGLATVGLVGRESAEAQVFFDPAQYGDQELRVSVVDSVRETVRRAILKDPKIAPAFYQLAIMDGLSYNAKTEEFGPDGSILKAVFSSKETDEYTKNLQTAGLTMLMVEEKFKKKNAISLADAIAIGGAEAIESIGGPILPVQLGRADTVKQAKYSDLPIDLFSGKYSGAELSEYFRKAGMTDREMTALLAGLLTLEFVGKSRTADDWKQSAKPKFREAGKIGRMSEFRKLTDEDIAIAEAQAELEADPEYEDPDDGWYIADTFGTRETRFGDRLGKDVMTEKTFNMYVKELSEATKKKGDVSKFGWIGQTLLDPNTPTVQTWLVKYAGSNLNYVKDITVAFNSVTQLGAVYTGGKYESLLKGRPRKSLNDDELNLF
jgi:hypothetical protein